MAKEPLAEAGGRRLSFICTVRAAATESGSPCRSYEPFGRSEPMVAPRGHLEVSQRPRFRAADFGWLHFPGPSGFGSPVRIAGLWRSW